MCASSYMRSRLHPLVVVLTPSGTRKLIESMIIHRSEDDHQQVHGSAVDHENSHKLHGRISISVPRNAKVKQKTHVIILATSFRSFSIPRVWECKLTIHYQRVKAYHQAHPG
ncbi:hypothetical protein AFLA_009375 [Aspergillus flavus NRRL3357]|nr:hypothetical protein AFLA_009375 [Aspergillus flavus NRRL3357]